MSEFCADQLPAIARRILEERDSGRPVDAHRIEWAESILSPADPIRTAFERDYIGDGPTAAHSMARNGRGYVYASTQTAWSLWQRAWAAALESVQ